jgi:3-isopropylmalate/(R)-2-methylmalate dehydratase small subunit
VLTVDLRTCTVRLPDGRELAFDVPAEERKMLLEGLDAIGVTMQKASEILAFQQKDRELRPWIWG